MIRRWGPDIGRWGTMISRWGSDDGPFRDADYSFLMAQPRQRTCVPEEVINKNSSH